jgi:hypothetical protein
MKNLLVFKSFALLSTLIVKAQIVSEKISNTPPLIIDPLAGLEL